MLTFLRKAFEFVVRPSHSRTLGLVLMLVLVAAVSLTVYVAQQQQETRQRAASIECGGVVCDPGQYCKSSGSDEFCADLPPTSTPTPTPCGGLGQTCCSTIPECRQSGTFCSENFICTTVKTPTPTPIIKLTNCGDLFCTGNQKCLIEDVGGQGEGKRYSCVTSTSTTIVCLKSNGDANCDGKINITDFNIWRDEFKKFTDGLTADFNKDGRITIVDFNILRDGLRNTNLPHQ